MIWWYHWMIVSVHPMLFQETYREVFAHDAQQTLKCSGFFQNLVENFIIFLTSTRSPKTEFGAESYGQNTEGQRRE
jgi:hypothetical protein